MITIEKWAGLATNASPYSIPPGAAVTQVNLQCLVPGQLSVRPGMTAITFTSHTGATSRIVSAIKYPGSPDAIVYQNASGAILVGRGPS